MTLVHSIGIKHRFPGTIWWVLLRAICPSLQVTGRTTVHWVSGRDDWYWSAEPRISGH